MKTGNENLTHAYNDRLVRLYKEVKNIDVINCRGWALNVAKDMYNLGILKHEDKSPHENTDTQKNDTHIHNHNNTKHTLQNHVNGQCFGVDWLQNYCLYFGCSSDYLLGNIDTFIHTPYDDIPLTLKSINALKKILQGYVEQWGDAALLTSAGIYREPYNTIDMLNFVISNPAFEKLIYAIEDYIHPEYNKPMCFVAAGENVGGIKTKKADYHIPTNQIHKRGTDNYIPLVKDENTPTDYRAVKIDDSFLENVAMLQIQKCIDTIKAEYKGDK